MNIDDLQRITNKVRKNGEASVGGTLIPGLNAKAYPIFDLQSQAILAATWVTTTGRGEQTKCPIAQKLRLVCEEISRSVGGRAPSQ
jgi:DNA-binding IclR family transcriptional regulator